MKAKRPKSLFFSLVAMSASCFVFLCFLVVGCPADTGCKTDADCPDSAKPVCSNGTCTARTGGDSGPQDTPANRDAPPPRDDSTPTDTPNNRDQPPAGPKDIGHSCSDDAGCKTGLKCLDPGGLGVKVCTQTCQNNTTCGSDAFCDIHGGLKNGLCMPKCTTDADCKPYGDMPLCTSEKHCWKPGGIGALCNEKDECASGFECRDPGGFGPKVCTKACTDTADCGAGGICDKHDGVPTSYCLPDCSSGDCSKLPHMDLCTQEKHCWRKGNAGTLCSQGRECIDGMTCDDPGGIGTKICFKECTSDADCAIDGVTNTCADVGGKKVCMPSCTGDNDCAGFFHIGSCKNKVCNK